ncbi:hypothetical protein XENORESO_014524 [Xenotaenia resolanae]|uniref:Uncharacterized protein n=1 Tax=Xenotaenia resolanae TaxID=208358 RepID=A0ABV0VSY4_9TELE
MIDFLAFCHSEISIMDTSQLGLCKLMQQLCSDLLWWPVVLCSIPPFISHFFFLLNDPSFLLLLLRNPVERIFFSGTGASQLSHWTGTKAEDRSAVTDNFNDTFLPPEHEI